MVNFNIIYCLGCSTSPLPPPLGFPIGMFHGAVVLMPMLKLGPNPLGIN